MAAELTISGALVYEDDLGQADSLAVSNLIASCLAQLKLKGSQTIDTSEVPIDLGGVIDLGYAIFVNRDVANTIKIRVGTGDKIFANLGPGQFAILPMGDDAQVPYAFATGAPSKLEYFLCST